MIWLKEMLTLGFPEDNEESSLGKVSHPKNRNEGLGEQNKGWDAYMAELIVNFWPTASSEAPMEQISGGGRRECLFFTDQRWPHRC